MNLHGRRLLITRAREDATEWAAAIEQQGGHAVLLPCLRVEPIRDEATAARLREELSRANWLALTSRHGARSVAAILAEGDRPAPRDGSDRAASLPEGMRVAAVGPRTAAAALRELGRCDLITPRGTGRDLARILARRLREDASRKDGSTLPTRTLPPRVLAAGADRARQDLEEFLEPLGMRVARLAVYRTLPSARASPRRRIGPRDTDVVLLASPSAAEGLRNLAVLDPAVAIVTIGPATTRAARDLGFHVTAEARIPGIEGILEALP